MLQELLNANLPALQVVLLLLAAPLCALMPSGRSAWAFATLFTWASFAIVLLLLSRVGVDGPVHYSMGDWDAPFGIEYRIDLLNAYILSIVAGLSSVVMIFAKASVAKEISETRQPLFYTVYLLCLAGLLGIVSTNDAFNIFVFLEVSALSTYTLIAMGIDRRALSASFKYLVIGTLGATFILIGIGLLYMMTGTLNITDLAHRVPSVQNSRPVLAAFAFLTVGLCMKMALFPMHMWLPNAYAYSPSFVSAFLASTATKVSLYVLLRVLFGIFGYSFSFGEMPLGSILIIFAVPAIFVGSISAVFQPHVKKLLAFSSVAQMGYIALGIGLANTTGLLAALIHIANHAIAKGALFMAAGCYSYRTGDVKFSNIRGMAQEMPLTTLAFALAGLSMVGVPLTAGFISKWYLINAALESGLWPLVPLLLLSSFLALIYVWRVIETAFFVPKKRIGKAVQVKEAPASMLIATWILVALSLYFGMDTRFTAGMAEHISAALMTPTGEW